MVNKITSPITPLGEIDKINEVIDQVNTNTTDISGKQATLVSGTNIKTINNTSLLGSGDISIPVGTSTTVKINGTSITNGGVADIKTNGTYNATSNKIATMSDVPAEQVQSNWTETNTLSKAYIQNKPSLATVATSGSYNDLSNKPTIPTVNNATLTITQDGTTKGTFTANASSDVTINLDAGGGASRNIGEIIVSTIPLTDAGLHLLDGALLQYGSYQAFVDYIADLYDSGDYTAIFDTEANWQATVSQYGVCDKFVYDSVNNTVRLPKYSNKIYTGDIASTTPVKGNGMTMGLTNGQLNAGLLFNNSGVAMGNAGTYGTDVYTLASGSTNLAGTRSAGLTTDGAKSGIIADLSNITTSLDGYYYIVVATSTKTDIQVDIDEIATDLNGKMDVDMSNMNASSSAKKMVDNWGCPDYSAGISMGLPTYPTSTTTTTYTCPSAGIGKFWLLRSAAGYNIDIYVNNISVWSASALSAFGLTALIPLSKDDVVLVKTNGTSNTWEMATVFYPLKGEA